MQKFNEISFVVLLLFWFRTVMILVGILIIPYYAHQTHIYPSLFNRICAYFSGFLPNSPLRSSHINITHQYHQFEVNMMIWHDMMTNQNWWYWGYMPYIWLNIMIWGFWLVSLAVLLSIMTLGMLPTRRSIETHTAKWASALALAQLAEAEEHQLYSGSGEIFQFMRVYIYICLCMMKSSLGVTFCLIEIR